MSTSPTTVSIRDMFTNALNNTVKPVQPVQTEAQLQARFEQICQETVAARKIKPRNTRSKH